METIIKGTGVLTLTAPIPDVMLSRAYPYFTTKAAPDGGLWLELSPYPEVYDEAQIRLFLDDIKPYVKSGKIECTVLLVSGNEALYLPVKWSFRFSNGHIFRDEDGTGSCPRSACISE